MTQDDPSPPLQISYAQRPRYGNARVLVLLAGIFTLVAAGLDFLYAGLMTMYAFVFGTMDFPSPSPPTATMPAAFSWIWLGFAGAAVLSLAACGVKVLAAVKLLRAGRNARGWGLAASVVGCAQVWCIYLCFIPMAVGIFNLVVLCLADVAGYLRDPKGSLNSDVVQWPSAAPPPGSGG